MSLGTTYYMRKVSVDTETHTHKHTHTHTHTHTHANEKPLLVSCRNERWHVDEEGAGQRAVPQQEIRPLGEGGDPEVFHQI